MFLSASTHTTNISAKKPNIHGVQKQVSH